LGWDESAAALIGFAAEANAGTNYYVVDNDFTRASTAVQLASPYPAPTASSFTVMRKNRGTAGLIYTLSSASPLTYANVGPFDCTIYLTYTTGGASGITLQTPGQASASAVPPGANQIFVPVGATLTVTSSSPAIQATTFCVP
jgi:hypothetical protein